MTWQGIHGHDAIVERFRCSLSRGRLASTFLFVGPAGVGKRTVALKLAQALLCRTNPQEQLAPCGHCPACAQVEALSHPDLEYVFKPKDKSFIPVETFIGDREHRMREGLCHNIALKPFCGGRKIAIIDDADLLNQEGANCLLKTLEEPPPRSVIILIGTSEQRQLPTIRSRCQVVRFAPLPRETVGELLLTRGLVEEKDEAYRMAELCRGSLQQALELADPSLWEFRLKLLDYLGRAEPDSVGFAKALAAFVEGAGKEAPPRRARMRQVMSFATEFYRQLMRSLAGAGIEGDEPMQRAVANAHRSRRFDEETAAACVDGCLDAQAHVEANANQATLLEWWTDEMAAIGGGRREAVGVRV